MISILSILAEESFRYPKGQWRRALKEQIFISKLGVLSWRSAFKEIENQEEEFS